MEFWVENLVQLAKSTVNFRTAGDPEVLIVNQLLLDHALAIVRRDHAQRDAPPHVRAFDELVPAYRMAPLRGHAVDAGGATSLAQLLGNGQTPFVTKSPFVWEINAAMDVFKSEFQEKASAQHLADASLCQEYLVYYRAQTTTGAIVTSTAYQRPRKRISDWVLCQYQEMQADGSAVTRTYMACIRYFVKVMFDRASTSEDGAADEISEPSPSPERFASRSAWSSGTAGWAPWRALHTVQPAKATACCTFIS